MGWITSRGLLGRCARDVALTPAISAVTEPAVVLGPSAIARDALDSRDGLPEGVVTDVDLLRLAAR